MKIHRDTAHMGSIENLPVADQQTNFSLNAQSIPGEAMSEATKLPPHIIDLIFSYLPEEDSIQLFCNSFMSDHTMYPMSHGVMHPMSQGGLIEGNQYYVEQSQEEADFLRDPASSSERMSSIKRIQTALDRLILSPDECIGTHTVT